LVIIELNFITYILIALDINITAQHIVKYISAEHIHTGSNDYYEEEPDTS